MKRILTVSLALALVSLAPGLMTPTPARAALAAATCQDTNQADWTVSPQHPCPVYLVDPTTGLPAAGGAVPIAPSSTAVAASGLVLKAGPGLFFGGSAVSTATGYLLLYDAVALPSNGTVTPKECVPMPTAGVAGTISAGPGTALSMSTGIVLAFSTTGCFTQTASATAFITGQAQ